MGSKFLIYIERFWLIAAIAASFILIIYIFQNGFDQLNQFSFILVLAAWAMFLVRRGMRKRMARFEAEQKNSKKKPTKKEVK
jgi:Flp pilus assembly protein TadB